MKNFFYKNTLTNTIYVKIKKTYLGPKNNLKAQYALIENNLNTSFCNEEYYKKNIVAVAVTTFIENNIVGCLRIVNGKGYLGYCYLDNQNEVDQDEEKVAVHVIINNAATFCIKNNASLYSY